jgi:MraZ protein
MDSNPVGPSLVLYGEFGINVDLKGRLHIPSEVRKAIDVERDGDKFFIVVGENRHMWLYPDRVYENMVAKLTSKMAPGREVLKFDMLNFALARKVEPDKQNRLSLPPETVRRTGLGKEVTLVGMRDHLEVWDRVEWDQYIQKLLDERAAKVEADRERQDEQDPPVTT